jgi:hypothetical protein
MPEFIKSSGLLTDTRRNVCGARIAGQPRRIYPNQTLAKNDPVIKFTSVA